MKLRWRSFIGRAVRIHTPDQSIEGVLTHAYRDVLILNAAQLLTEGSKPIPLDGEVVLERSRISFGQVLG